MKSKIALTELILYFGLWIFANGSSLYKLFRSQNDLHKELPLEFENLLDLQDGWSFLSRYKDESDIEWFTWKFYIQVSINYLLFQFLIAEIIRYKQLPFLKYWYCISSLMYIQLYMGWKHLMVLFMQPIIFLCILFCGGKKRSIWITGISLLFTYNSLKYKYYVWEFFHHAKAQEEEVYLLLFTVAWVLLRCICFAVDYVDYHEKLKQCKEIQESKEKLTKISKKDATFNLITYALFLPVMFSGPLLLYEDFENSFKAPKEKLTSRIKEFMLDMCIFQFYTFLMDLNFHYIYFSAMQSNIELLKNLSTFALCGGGLWMGLAFHMKYVIFYGTASAFCRLHNIDAPPTPRCIARIHVYSQMWRYFDVGLYKFLLRYVYRPCFVIISNMVVLHKTMTKLLASFCTFLFVFLWHGAVGHIFIWASLNYIGITFEQLGKEACKTEMYNRFKKNVLKTEAMETRFTSLMCAPLLAVSAISNFYLFSGTAVGNIFVERIILNPTLWTTLVVILTMYCSCQCSIALEDVTPRTEKKKHMTQVQ